ncbi:MAG: hypothetical protein Q9169_008505, partial [Polycauliona sp. 2 TL-2023]
SVGEELAERIPHLWTAITDLVGGDGERTALKTFRQPAHNKTPTEVTWTYQELYHKADALAAYLFDRGVGKGDAIAVFADNQVEWVLLFWAAIRLDAVFVPLNPRVIKSKEEVGHVLRVTRPKVVVVADESAAREFQEVAAELMAEIPVRIVVDDGGLVPGWVAMLSALATFNGAKGWADGVEGDGNREDGIEEKAIEERNMPPSPVNALEQTMVVIFTSGTTSLPKASISTFGNVLASALAYKAINHVDSDSVLLQHLPAFHGWSICLSWGTWLSGATVVYPSRTFDAKSSLSAIESARCTHMPAVPSMIQALVTHPSLSATKVDSLQSIDLAGTMILPEIIEACMDKLKARYSSAVYGMTEGSAVCGSDMYDIPYGRHNIPRIIPGGKALPGARLRVCKPGSRDVLRRGEVGELHMGGLQVSKGYMDRPSDDFYQENGVNWLATGDQARMDDEGLVYILGRYKDLIIRGGENISPAMIEGCLDSIEGITDAQVVGLPDEIAGEVPVAVVVKSSALEVTDYDIQHKVSNELGRMFSPQHILGLQQLGLADYPRTTSGKIKKGDLKDRISQYVSTRDTERCNDQSTLTVDTLIRFWARLSGREVDSISPDEHAATFADSIMMMQFCNLVGKELGKTIAVEDI